MQLAERLVEAGFLPENMLGRALEAQAQMPDQPLHLILIEKGWVREYDLLNFLGNELGMPLIDLTKHEITKEALASMPHKIVHRYGILPVSRDNGTLTIATANPYDFSVLDELQTITGLEIIPVLASPRELARQIKTNFGVGGDTISTMVSQQALSAPEPCRLTRAICQANAHVDATRATNAATQL